MNYKFQGEEKLRQDICHKLSNIEGEFQIVCMPAKGMTRRRNVSRTNNSSLWCQITCLDCLKRNKIK